MANVSSRNGIEKRPKLQFRDANGQLFPAWKQYRFDMLYKPVSEKNDLSYGVESIISVANMYFKPDARISDPEYLRTYNIFKYGDIAFEGNKSKSYANGRFVENTIGDGIVSHVFNVLRPLSPIHNLEYWKYAINNENVMGRILARCTKKTTMMTNLVTSDFMEQEICCPVESEQEKIALFLSLIERRLIAQEQLVEHLKKYKRGVIQAVFDDEKRDLFGEMSSGKQVKLSDLMDFQNGINADASKYGRGIRYISVSDILKNNFITYDKIIGQVDIDSRALATYSVTYGDVLFQRSSETREDAGRSNVYLDTEKTATFGGFVIRGKKKGDYDPLYLKYALDSFVVRKQIMQCAAGAQHINVSQEDLCNIVVNLPTIDVQNRISKFISDIDSRIATEEKKANAQATLKKALLQQLFI